MQAGGRNTGFGTPMPGALAMQTPGLRDHRSADASIMPRVIGGNTDALTIIIGERCAEFVAAVK